MDQPLILLTAGGTGGHFFPAQALAQELMARGVRVALATDRRGQDLHDRASASAGTNAKVKANAADALPAYRIPAAGFAGPWHARLRACLLLVAGIMQGCLLLRRLRPVAVVGFGGYACAPTLIAAWLLRVPILIHEQNAVLGRANRWLARLARAVATSFADTRKLTGATTPQTQILALTGLPVRAAILALHNQSYPSAAAGARLELLILGGSQGARIFADIVPAALAGLPPELRARLHVTQQCRAEDLERATAHYARAGIAADLASFFTDITPHLRAAHLAIARAGASTLAELLIAGVPALMVPLPSATDDHQRANAEQLCAAGAGWLILQQDFTPEYLGQRLAGLLNDTEALRAASRAAQAIARPDAARRLADLAATVAGPAGRLAPSNPSGYPL